MLLRRLQDGTAAAAAAATTLLPGNRSFQYALVPFIGLGEGMQWETRILHTGPARR